MSFRKPQNRAVYLALAGFVWCAGSVAQSQEMLDRKLLVNMARSQFSTLCQSEVFASCMGFTAQACTDLSENAIDQCLMPLPEEIDLEKLDNAALESCPKDIYADAGFGEEKAALCFDKAMEAFAAEGKK